MNNLEKKELLGYDPERDIEGLYGAIPIAIIADKRLKPSTKLAAIVIALSCNNTKGIGHRSNRKISKLANLSDRSVERAFQELEKYDYLAREWDNERQQRFYQWTFEIGKRLTKRPSK